MIDDQRNYDVAISFRASDLDLAKQLSELLDGLEVFVYEERQREIAGGDGMRVFRQTFRSRSRLNLVLYRDGWGQTPWTRIEETAIQERCLEDGWDTLLFIDVEAGVAVPDWLPDHRIRFPLHSHSIDELVETVLARLTVVGGDDAAAPTLAAPTGAIARAAQIADATAFARETEQLVRSPEGMQQAFHYVNEVLRVLTEAVESMGERGLAVAAGGDQRHFVMRCQGVSMVLNWQYYANSIDGCPLYFNIFRGAIPTPDEQQQGRSNFFNPQERGQFQYDIERVPDLGFCIRGQAGSALDVAAAADEIMGRFLDAYEAHKDEQFP